MAYSFNYNMTVRQRLAAWREEHAETMLDIKYTDIQRKMKDLYQIDISTQKLSDMFNPTSTRELKLEDVVALCNILKLPLNDIVAFPNAPSLDLPVDNRFIESDKNKISQLKNKYYSGNFYGYYFHPKHYEPVELGNQSPITGMELEEAKIRVYEDNGDTLIEFTELSQKRNFFEDEDLERFVLKGKLYLLERKKMAYTMMMDMETRRIIILLFEFRDFSKDILWFTTASMLSISLNEKPIPIFQKIALFRVQQDIKNQEEESVIRGILALDSNPIIIEKDKFDKLVKDQLDLNKLPITPHSYYSVSESFLRDQITAGTFEENMKLILKIREQSALSPHEIIRESEAFRNFIKSYQQAENRTRGVELPISDTETENH